jgi:hypothetical protein
VRMSRHPNPIRSARPTRSLQFAVCSPSPESHPSLCRLIFACHAGHDDRVLETLLLIASVRAADTARTGIVLAALWGHVLDVVGSRAIARRIQRLSTFALRRRLLPFATLCCSQRARKSNVSDRHCCRRTPRLMSTTLKARRLRDGQLPIVGGHEGCTHHHVRGCNVKRIQAAREQRGDVSAWTSRPIHRTLIMIGSFACGSALCSTPTRSVTHALRIGAGRSIVTKASR